MSRCIPPISDRDGYHWVRRFKTGPAIPIWWCAQWHENAGRGWGKYTEADREDQWEYLGPCWSHEQIAAERAKADALAEALRMVVAWDVVIETIAPEIGGAVTAMAMARAALAAYESDAPKEAGG